MTSLCPVTEVDLDGSSDIFPFYDADTNMLYVVGKVSLAQERGRCLVPLAWGPWSARQGQGQARVAGSSIPVGSPQPSPTFLASEHLGPGLWRTP